MIVTASDSNEQCLRKMLAMLRSLRANSPEEPVCVYLVDCPELVASHVNNAHDAARVVDVNPNAVKDRRGFMVCFRATAVREQLDLGKHPVCWMDADVIVRGSLKPLFETIGGRTFSVVERPGKQERDAFQAGVFVIGNSLETRAMIAEWEEALEGRQEWYADQLWLRKTYLSNRQWIDFKPLDEKYNNVGDESVPEPFSASSVVWHCKGAHFEHPTFQQEFRKYDRAEP